MTDAETTVSLKFLGQFSSEEGDQVGPELELPVDITTRQLDEVLNKLLRQDDFVPFSYWIGDTEVTETIGDLLLKKQKNTWADEMMKAGRRFKRSEVDAIELQPPTEEVLRIVYRPQAVFRVRPVTRCTSSLAGHSEAVIAVAFSPCGNKLLSGSGDCTIRAWDLHTQTVITTLRAHQSWVQVLAWAPNGSHFVSGSKDAQLAIWDGETMEQVGTTIKAHKKWITAVAWEPLHKNLHCDRFVSASKDCTLKVWKLEERGNRHTQWTLSGHTAGVTCVKWGGQGYIYSCSQDHFLMVWDADAGTCVRRLEGHAHWVNHMALNTDIVLRTGSHDHTEKTFETPEAAQKYALERYEAVVKAAGDEILVSCSDDNTLCLWHPTKASKPVNRLAGHQKIVNHVSFSPDGKTIASASFDKSVKLWHATEGRHIATLRNHVGSVYQVAWSLDSRLLISASADSTVKLYSLKTQKLLYDLPGHADEVYAVDWSPDGITVASGSKDKTIKIWKN
eukprot:TRINITY_DN31308_c0_g1_i1.p1 TRINITY_DN31308_c0_g1~~TRINITY_DN31308_c0_g1_i1.p1  ORF type:complete len:512 (+),score=88.86 TRINITY_DN31308_c0_g1_i1:23-1537(+)